MEVRDIFKLRSQGKTEEAYAAICPLYAVHKGPHTTICMFWVGMDMMRLRYRQRRLVEAYKIFQALLRLYPTMDDTELRGQAAMMRAALLVFDHNPEFSMLDFITRWGITRLTDEDWKIVAVDKHPIPSLGMRIVGKVFHEVNAHPTIDMALAAAPILAEALRHSPYNFNNQRYKAIIYKIMGKTDKAINIYRHLIAHHHQSYLYQELADLATNKRNKIALLTTAIARQREEKFRQKMKWQLANLLYNNNNPIARHELDQCIAIRKANGFSITYEIQNLMANLESIPPAKVEDVRSFYRQQEQYVATLAIE